MGVMSDLNQQVSVFGNLRETKGEARILKANVWTEANVRNKFNNLGGGEFTHSHFKEYADYRPEIQSDR